MEIEYIIVQAGGKGTRLEYLTENKPKALVPIYNLPMMFHLFRKYPDKKFIIIGDYKKDVLRKYMNAFADVKYLLIDAKSATGTCAGIKEALTKIPNNMPFMLIWSDLILPKLFDLPKVEGNYVGISKDFRCRWSYKNDKFIEEPSYDYGVAGFFIFRNRREIEDVSESGEFVRWLQTKDYLYRELDLSGTKEFGLFEEYNKLQVERCRPFNKMTVLEDRIIKEGIDDQGKKLSRREKNWYQYVMQYNFPNIPKIYDFDVLTMEKIQGKNIFEYVFTTEEKKDILKKIVECLQKLHTLVQCEPDYFSRKEAYISKTFDRLNKVRDLIPFADRQIIRINGKECRNVFFHQKELEDSYEKLKVSDFCLIHGDCTFSNIMLRDGTEPVIIDPRGYFGFTELLGDAAYDWAKLYYSIKGNYDKFNIKDFRLNIQENEVNLKISSNGWEELEDYYFELIGNDTSREDIKFIHAIIWLSLTTYAWQDYDSVCGAFYNGLYYLEEFYDNIL